MITIVVHESPELYYDNVAKYIGYIILVFKIIFYLLKTVYLLKY